MIAKIIKITDKIRNNSPEYKSIQGYSYNLPLLSTNLGVSYQEESSLYVLQIWQIVSGYRYPILLPFVNEDDFKKINAYWDWVVEEELDDFEFLL